MNILFLGISGYEYPHVRVRCYRFARHLATLGLQTSVLSFKDHLAPEISETQMYAHGDAARLRLVLKSLPRLLLAKNTIFYFQKLHYHTAAAHLLTRFARRPFILDYDDYEIGLDSQGNQLFSGFYRPWLNRLFYGQSTDAAITEQAARRALACITSSHHLYEYLKPFNPRTYLIPTGADTSLFHPQNPPDPNLRSFTFIWTGVVWGDLLADNLKFIITAFKEVRRAFPGCLLKIAGGGAYMPAVKSFAEQELPPDSIEFLGWIPADQVPQVLRTAHAGLLPLTEDTPWTRSKSPTKLFEYLASGLPVVASPTGEANYIIHHGVNGFLAPNLSDFITAMKTLCGDHEKYAEMSIQAVKTIQENYSLDILGNKLFNILHDQLAIH